MLLFKSMSPQYEYFFCIPAVALTYRVPFFFCLYSEVTEGALQVWRALPERIRQDPSLASFRQEHERLHGKQC